MFSARVFLLVINSIFIILQSSLLIIIAKYFSLIINFDDEYELPMNNHFHITKIFAILLILSLFYNILTIILCILKYKYSKVMIIGLLIAFIIFTSFGLGAFYLNLSNGHIKILWKNMKR